ncbi:MAG: fused MFS/spermidine synthase [Saprospiraceae bacterium]|jgi:spermidine synthase|nr:fused MFS/spermidine synthase [Saprospiraceae bacterium]
MEKIAIPSWKKYFSYIFPIKIESSSSVYNPLLVVNLTKGRLQLLTENAIYSYDDLYDNFDAAFSQLNISDVKEVLVLGLGLGSIPYLLEKKYRLQTNITAIEIDEEIIHLASKYSLHRLNNHIDCVCADAEIFLESTDEKFDLICMDVFEDESIPSQFLSSDFLEMIRERLNPNGIFLFNHLATTGADKDIAKKYFVDVFTKSFRNASIIPTNHNFILLQDSSRLKVLI